MPLEPVNTAASAASAASEPAGDPFAPMIAGLSAIENPPAAADPVTPAEEVVVKPTPDKADDKAALDKLEADKDDDPADKLPVEEKTEDEKQPKEPKNPAGYRIQELNKEIKDVLKPQIAELEQTIAQRDARLLELEGVSTELEELRQFKKDAEVEMSVVRLEQTEAFKTTVTAPLKAIETSAKAIAAAYGIDEAKLFEVFAIAEEPSRRKALKELTSGLDIDQDDAFELRKLISDAQPVFKQRDDLYANSDQALAALEARREKETATQAAARGEERSKATDVAITRTAKALPFFGEIITEVSPKVKATNFDALDLVNQGYNAVAGAALPAIAKKYASLQADYDAALDELEGYKKASPKADGGFVQHKGAERGNDFGAAMLKGLGMGAP